MTDLPDAQKIKEEKNNFLRGLIKGLSWEDLLFICLVIVLLFLNYKLIAPLKQLNGPLYGGDAYNHLGSMEHIYQGGSVFESGQLLGEIPWVPWFYHLLVVGFAKATGIMPLWKAVTSFSLILTVVCCLAVYLLVSRMFSNKILGILAVIWLAMNIPIMKYTYFAITIMHALFLLSAYLFLKKENWKTAVFMGIMYGLAGLSNTHSFMIATLFMFFFLIYYVLIRALSKKSGKIKLDKKIFFCNLKKGALIFILGFLIAMLWWYKPIFVYHAKTANDLQIYGFIKVETFSDMLSLVITSIKGAFFNFGSLGWSVISLGAFFGLLLLFFVKNKRTEHILLIILMITLFFGLFSHFITIPLLGTHIAPSYLFGASMTLTIPLLFFFFAKFLISRLPKKIGVALIIALFILFAFTLHNYFTDFTKGKWYEAGKTELPQYMLDITDWVKKNTDLNDVFITTNEDGFGLNALTGRKVITYRRTHAPTYADMNQRMLDAALILYGNNNTMRKELIKKYKVKYLFWHYRWLQNEFQINEKGEVVGTFDPLMFDYSEEREKILKLNNISYKRMNWYLDPAWVDTYPKRDVLVALPSQFDPASPWNKQMDKYLELRKEVKHGSQALVKIYRIKS